jgi:hypothetical protein
MGKIVRLAGVGLLALTLGSVGCQCCSKKTCDSGGCQGGCASGVASAKGGPGCAGGNCGTAQAAAAEKNYMNAGMNATGTPYAQPGTSPAAATSYTSYGQSANPLRQ